MGIVNGRVDRVDEAFVGCNVEGGVTTEDFFMEFLVNAHSVCFYHVGSGLVVACGADALDFGEELTEEAA